jgi:hypothetical protein
VRSDILDKPDAYERKKRREGERQAKIARAGRDCSGWVHEPEDPARRAAALASLEQYCLAYHAGTFHLKFSADHRKAIGKIEQAVRSGGLFALAMARASGKTSLCVAACLWAALGGMHEFIALLASNEEAAKELLASIKIELETNGLLHADFSEVTGPVRALEGIVNRCGGQLHEDSRTFIRWTAKEIALPVVPDSASSGVVVRVGGILGRIRGMQFKRHDGRTVRPSLVLIDDPSTDESADSPEQNAKRERVLAGAVLGLSGPGKKISGLLPCTVIRPGDVADRVLDPQLHPEWNGERMSMLYALPEREDLWAKYAELRKASLRAGRQGEEATDFYRDHREEMDRGSVVAWKERHNPDELSALQHAMNLKIRDEESWLAEYQNCPKRPDETDANMLTADEIAARLSRIPEGIAPADAQHLVAAVDVHDRALVWVVAAFAADFTGSVISHGCYPKQPTQDYLVRKASPCLADLAPGAGREGAILAGLNALADELLAREWKTELHVSMRIGLLLVDHGYLPDVVFQFARRSPHAALILPSRGAGVGAKARPMSEYLPREGETHGWNYLIRPAAGRAARHVVFDSNAFKEFAHQRLAVVPGDRGALTLFGDNPARHALFARHMCGERPVKVTSGGRSVWEWSPVVGAENHLLDCCVMAAVAATIKGCVLAETMAAPKPKKKGPTLRELYDLAREKQGRAPAR